MTRVTETRVANRTVDAEGRAGDRRAYRGDCVTCGRMIIRVTDQMLEDELETA